eukprot:scaffold2261_cov124-Cylindrotheca_fusiformis.AAC.4
MSKSTKEFHLGPKQLPEDFRPSEFDVICSWARQNFSTAGNKRLRGIIADNVEAYQQAETKVEKGKIIEDIVNQVMALSPSNSGFIRQDKQTGRWSFIGFDKSKDKVGHALRQASKQKVRNGKRKEIPLEPKSETIPAAVSIISRPEYSPPNVPCAPDERAFAHHHPYYWYPPHPHHPPPAPTSMPMPYPPPHMEDGSQTSSFKRFKPLSAFSSSSISPNTVESSGPTYGRPSMPSSDHGEEEREEKPTDAGRNEEFYHQDYHHHRRRPSSSYLASPRGSPTSVADVGKPPAYMHKRDERHCFRGGGGSPYAPSYVAHGGFSSYPAPPPPPQQYPPSHYDLGVQHHHHYHHHHTPSY